eukprot:scaffold8459_cov121-Isochrysis_galbana.AAC.10
MSWLSAVSQAPASTACTSSKLHCWPAVAGPAVVVPALSSATAAVSPPDVSEKRRVRAARRASRATLCSLSASLALCSISAFRSSSSRLESGSCTRPRPPRPRPPRPARPRSLDVAPAASFAEAAVASQGGRPLGLGVKVDRMSSGEKGGRVHRLPNASRSTADSSCKSSGATCCADLACLTAFSHTALTSDQPPTSTWPGICDARCNKR